jgi:hypothetical protein
MPHRFEAWDARTFVDDYDCQSLFSVLICVQAGTDTMSNVIDLTNLHQFHGLGDMRVEVQTVGTKNRK